MENEIEAILEPLRAKGHEAGSEFNGKYWEVWVGSHAGAREDGLGLAIELAANFADKPEPVAEPQPEPQDIPMFLREPEFEPEPEHPDPHLDLQAARIAELEAELEAQKARATDMFDASDLADLLRENEPHGEARERLWTLFRNAQTLIADNGKSLPAPTSDDYMIFARLYPHLGWLAKSGAVEVV